LLDLSNYKHSTSSLFDFVDVTDVTEVSLINRYVICERCKVLIPDVDNLDDHVCEAAAAAVASDADGEMIVESSKGYPCRFCNKTFAQVIHSQNCQLCTLYIIGWAN